MNKDNTNETKKREVDNKEDITLIDNYALLIKTSDLDQETIVKLLNEIYQRGEDEGIRQTVNIFNIMINDAFNLMDEEGKELETLMNDNVVPLH